MTYLWRLEKAILIVPGFHTATQLKTKLLDCLFWKSFQLSAYLNKSVKLGLGLNYNCKYGMIFDVIYN